MQARLRAQLGDRSKYSGERRRRSVVVASIVLTITDPLRGSYPFWYYLQAALIRSCGASFACMELTIISRFQRLYKHPQNLYFIHYFYSFSVLCRRRVSKALIHYGLHRNMPKACPYVMTQFVCPSIVADINHRKLKQTKRTVPLVCFGLFALSDNLISEVWFFAEGERFLSFWRCHRPRKRAALGVWCG